MSPAGFEPTAPRLGIWCSIRLSYGDATCGLAQSHAQKNRWRSIPPVLCFLAATGGIGAATARRLVLGGARVMVGLNAGAVRAAALVAGAADYRPRDLFSPSQPALPLEI